MSWKTTTIGSVCEVIAGQSPESSFYNKDGKGLAFYQGKKDFGEKYISDPTVWTTQITKEAEQGDILMSVRAPVGPVNLATQRICIGRGLAAIRAKNEINKEYLFYFLRKIESELVGSSGAVFNSINKSQIASIKIPLPSLATQHKIVEKLDAIFAEIDRATVATEANVKNAELLYRTSVNQVFETFKEKEVKLKNISSINYGYTAKSSLENDGYHYLRITDIQEDFVEWINVPKVDVATSEIRKYILKDGDIVFARTGATTGKSYLVKDAPNAIFASYLIRVDVNRGEILPAYIKHYFNSEEYWNNVNAGISGAAQGGFNASKLGELLIPYVSLERQNLVVKELSTLERTVNEMRNNYFTKLTELNSLRNSILKQAFNGELVKE